MLEDTNSIQNTLSLKPILALLNYSFEIASYQRGYRWIGEYQVNDLLNDIFNYKINHNNPDAFYCLQPIVVKQEKVNNFELIDGQQRLTTILLILHYFNESEFKNPKKIFEIHFRTRNSQENFLEIITDKEKCKHDIDLYHLNNAYSHIEAWFNEKENSNPSIRSDFHSKLVNHVKVIWYELNKESNNNLIINVFTRLNIGKIPLTNAELIKALILGNVQKNLDKEDMTLEQARIALEWDNIEKKLQQPEFWHFIYPGTQNKYATRIEFIFDLMKSKEHYYTFHAFYQDIEKKLKSVSDIWSEIKTYFMIFEEWYIDHELYNIIGCILYLKIKNYSIKNIIANSKGNPSKKDFKLKLIQEVISFVNSGNIQNLSFDNVSDKIKIKNVLLAFNILTLINNKAANSRFPFHHFYNQSWDIPSAIEFSVSIFFTIT